MSKHYDAVVLGTSVGALATAALLSRRSWRVLVVGQGQKPCFYSFEGLTLARRAFTLLGAASPAWTRILVELAQSQTFRRRITALDPMTQVLLPGRRIELPPDTALFAREIDREFPEVRRVVDDLYAELARTNAAADAAFERDVTWPPGGFWERRETGRIVGALPHVRDGARDYLAEFPRDHEYRAVVEVTARMSSDLYGELPPFALARLHGAWTRGVSRLARGEDEVADFLLDRIRAQGGEVELSARVDRLVVRGGKVRGAIVDGDVDPTGVQFVIAALPSLSLVELADGFEPSRRSLAALPELRPRARRFVVSVVARDDGIPDALAHESFIVPDPHRLHGAIHVQRHPAGDPALGASLLVAETLVSDDDPPVDEQRTRVLARLQRFFPFLERHLMVVDSPHDGQPLWDHRGGDCTLVDRVRTRAGGGSIDAEAMDAQYEVDPPHLYGLAGEPSRTPLGNAFVVGKTTMPALGQEGELLSAWGVARIITRTDRRKERMRREMWSKVELG